MSWFQKIRTSLGGQSAVSAQANAHLTGGYEGASGRRRLSQFPATRAHANTLIGLSGLEMTSRARHLVRNNGYAVNAVDSFAANMVGDGIKPSAIVEEPKLKKSIQRLWLDWTDEADFEDVTDFYGVQRRVAREVFIAGECFVRLLVRPQNLFAPLVLQVLPSEMLPLHKTEAASKSNWIRQGIEFDKRGRRVAYHMYRQHPGDVSERQDQSSYENSQLETVRIPADQILHIHDPLDAGQLRGVSRFASVISKLYLLDQYDDAELDRKKVAALFAGFITRNSGEVDYNDPIVGELQSQSEGIGITDLQPGTLQFLEDGEDIRFSDPADVGGSYEAFQYRTLLNVASGLGMPYASITSDMLKANYSNTRAALLEFRRRATAFQHSVLVFQLCRPVWKRWIALAVMAGEIDAKTYAKNRRAFEVADWLPPRWEWVDPQKDIRAEIEAINAGIKSRSQAVSERGYDAEALDVEIAADRKREKELGLDFRDARLSNQGSNTAASGADPSGNLADNVSVTHQRKQSMTSKAKTRDESRGQLD